MDSQTRDRRLSTTFNNQTKFWRLDYRGVFRLINFDPFIIPRSKKDFGFMAKTAILQCLQLAMRLKAEMSARETCG
jgi:hypothetical protein